MFENCSFHQFPFIVMKYYEAKATILCGACANYNPDLGRGMIGHSRPVAYGPRALKRPLAIRDWSGMADHAPALGLDCIFPITSTQRQPSLVGQHVFKTRTEDIQQRQQRNYNERHRARELPDLPPGTRVYIPDRQEEGQTATSPTTRSYIVTPTSGDFRRNRRHITPLPQPSSSNTPVPSAPSTSNTQPAQDRDSSRQLSDAQTQPTHSAMPQKGNEVTVIRSGRISCPPTRLNI